ncbi:diadenylate cyclase CdaA [Synechocystis sp. LKSZ1]|uniref:diadenylate cyclase CdaA n=1 Tax=Synechocystis sp. LKSZ1 TaxID=3144951 RepID=UPI00336C1EC2
MSGFPPDPQSLLNFLHSALDLGLVIGVFYGMTLIIGEYQTIWMLRGLLILMVAQVVSERLHLELLQFVLEKLVLGSAVALAVIFQVEFRRFLELLGRGRLMQIFQRPRSAPKIDNVIDEIIDAVKELSQNRIGALMVMETQGTLDSRIFVNRGVSLNSELSKELLQTIFQPKTLLHDGAVFIRGTRVVAAGVILPLSERSASRQLGTRHRAAMGITERSENCLCIVVSEETGSITLAERGNLNRPLTSSKLKELLELQYTPLVERETVAPSLGRLRRTLGSRSQWLLKRLFFIPSSTSPDEKK